MRLRKTSAGDSLLNTRTMKSKLAQLESLSETIQYELKKITEEVAGHDIETHVQTAFEYAQKLASDLNEQIEDLIKVATEL